MKVKLPAIKKYLPALAVAALAFPAAAEILPINAITVSGPSLESIKIGTYVYSPLISATDVADLSGTIDYLHVGEEVPANLLTAIASSDLESGALNQSFSVQFESELATDATVFLIISNSTLLPDATATIYPIDAGGNRLEELGAVLTFNPSPRLASHTFNRTTDGLPGEPLVDRLLMGISFTLDDLGIANLAGTTGLEFSSVNMDPHEIGLLGEFSVDDRPSGKIDTMTLNGSTLQSITIGENIYDHLSSPVGFLTMVEGGDFLHFEETAPENLTDAVGSKNMSVGTLNQSMQIQFAALDDDSNLFLIVNENDTSPNDRATVYPINAEGNRLGNLSGNLNFASAEFPSLAFDSYFRTTNEAMNGALERNLSGMVFNLEELGIGGQAGTTGIEFETSTLDTHEIGLVSSAQKDLGITKITYDPENFTISLTWNSRLGAEYAVSRSSDLLTWEEIDDPAGESGMTTIDYILTPEDRDTPRLFFRVEGF